MATLENICWNLLFGGCVTITSCAGFGYAIRSGGWNDWIAPRVWARPSNVIRNVLKDHFWFGWISWALHLTYQQLLDGIPGTGTRDNGCKGPLLKTNLDGVILVKFHALGFKIATFATILGLAVTLPLNLTAVCDPFVVGSEECSQLQNLTNYEKTTLAHIPSLKHVIDKTSFSIFDINGRLYGVVIVAIAVYLYTGVLLWREWIDNLALRRVFYLEHDHWRERREELEDIMQLDKDGIPQDPLQRRRPPWLPHPELRETVPNVSLYSVLFQLPSELEQSTRHQYETKLEWQLAMTTEFFDQCVPNQPGYSSSVAAVTMLPEAAKLSLAWGKWYACASKLRRLRFIRRIKFLRQQELEHAKQVVSPELPQLRQASSPQLGSKPLATVKENQPLSPSGSQGEGETNKQGSTEPDATPDGRDTRQAIADSITSTTTLDTSPSTATDSSADKIGSSQSFMQPASRTVTNTNKIGVATSTMLGVGLADDHGVKAMTTGLKRAFLDHILDPQEQHEDKAGAEIRPFEEVSQCRAESLDSEDLLNEIDRGSQRFTYAGFVNTRPKYSKSIGLGEESQLDVILADFGVEQTAVYSRELAQSSASCCPYGCGEDRVRQGDLEELELLEKEAEDDVREANVNLIQARASVNQFNQSMQSARQDSATARRSSSKRIEYATDDVSWKPADEENGDDNAYDPEYAAISANMPQNGDLRRRSTTGSDSQWEMVKNIIVEHSTSRGPRRRKRSRELQTGRWAFPFNETWRRVVFHRGKEMVEKNAKNLKHAASKSGAIIAKHAIEDRTYAVVTFTSRQAALAARQCLADGTGLNRWKEVEDIPVPPLADAAPNNFWACRGCCRPVTLTINDNQKTLRRYIARVLILLFCGFYTVPLTFASALLAPSNLAKSFPALQVIRDNDQFEHRLAGLFTGIVWSVFFSTCPYLFRAIANYGSGATSVRQAEYFALQYYWFFALLTAFTGTSLSNMVINGFNSGVKLGQEAQEVLRSVAAVIPTQISATFLNWMVVRFTITLPLFYLFQFNTFLFGALGLKCCARCVRGGGPGGAVPYRIYVDSGIVFLCVVALAPASPLVSPAALMYYLIFSPMIRWLLIFVYRPAYDGGGQRWPFIFEMFISAMLLGQVLLAVMMSLKKAPGPAILAGLTTFPTILFRNMTKDRFLRPYLDAGLLQMSKLDGWDNSEPTSWDDREEFRQWIVDCHKASFVPICLAGLDSFLTAEPAVAIPLARDTDADEKKEASPRGQYRDSPQRGATFRRLSYADEGNKAPGKRHLFL